MSNPINSITYDPYELMIIFPNKKAEMIIKEIQKFEPNLNLVRDLIILGANLDWRDEEERQHWSALHWATNINNLEITKMLVGAGSDVNIRTSIGETPLHFVACDNLKSTKLLIKSGADVNAADDYFLTPLHEATIFNQPQIVKILIESGANVNVQSEEGESPLHMAAINDCFKSTKMLIDAGANVNASNEGGCTPLHYTALYNSIKSSKLLIKSGAKLDIKDENGKLPYDLARSEEMKTILRIV
jgi:serine/threonine-protein phosphatase 6 regulatory ankyrin repeat subunit B